MTQESISKKLSELFELHNSGAITKEEYDSLKSKLLTDNGIKPTVENPKEPITLQSDELLSDQAKHDSLVEDTKPKSKMKFGKNATIAVIVPSIIIVSVVLFKFFGTEAKATKVKSDLNKLNLIGKVKSVLLLQTFIIDNNGKENNDKIKSHFILYDEIGNIIGSELYNDGKLSAKYVRKYNNQGKLIDETSYDPFGNINENTTHTYDEKGNPAEFHQKSRTFEYKTSSLYDEKGNIIQQTENHTGSKQAIRTFTYKYDSKGRKVEEVESNNPQRPITYTYDKNGNMVKKEIDHMFKYDINGNTLEEIEIDSDGKVKNKILCKYDLGGNNIERVKTTKDGADNIRENKVVNKYDENGNIVETKDSWKTRNYNKVVKYEYKYEFDKVGNWVKQTEFKDDKKSHELERTIEYY